MACAADYEHDIRELQAKLANAEERHDHALQQSISRLRSMFEYDKKEAIAAVRQQCQEKWNDQLEELKAKLNGQQQCPTCEPLDTLYQYDRSRVLPLTQLICRYLENIPNNVDRNRIYNCVKRCYDDLEQNYTDNPEHYRTDVRMLLNVCRAANWFSPKQFANINRWCFDQGWNT